MRDIEYILDFAVHLGREMLDCGANLERANHAMIMTCKAYNLHEVSLFSLSSTISISAKDNDGKTFVRQLAVPGGGIHLPKLKKLNELSREVCREAPEPEKLEDMLYQALMVTSYGPWLECLGFMIACGSLCRIFKGGWPEIIVTLINTLAVYWIGYKIAKENLNRIISNVLCMFAAAAITFLFLRVGFVQVVDPKIHIMPILTATSLVLIPGVPLVNAVRNILCGNEMNGILELLKVLLEVVTICAGVYLGYFLFGNGLIGQNVSDVSVSSLELVLISFLSSLGFGMVFQLRGKDLVLAGIGGSLIRLILIVLSTTMGSDHMIAYSLLSALFAAIFAEILAHVEKCPSTCYLYPFIIPLIPADRLFYALGDVLVKDWGEFAVNTKACIYILIGITVGFVLASTFAVYARKVKER